MQDSNVDNIKSQMRKGVLEYCILSMLKGGDAYASLIISSLKDARMIVVEGTLYPLLTRLKNQGLLNYRWEESTQGPPRKYYTITDLGRTLKEEQEEEWYSFSEAINKLLKGDGTV